MKSAIKAALCGLYKYSGVLRAHETLARWTGQQLMAILVFHRVTDAIPEDPLTVSTARFRKVCQLLRRNFRVVSLGEVFETVRSGRPMPPRTVAITFDDCYRDNLDAARVLAEYELPACFFVPSAFVGTDHVFPWDRGLPHLPNLSWDDVRVMAGLGFEIGSHSARHLDLGVVSVEEAREEIFESKRVIEQEVGRRVRWFAYPFGGRHNFRVTLLPLLEEAGYEGCVSAFGGLIRPGADGRILPREAVPPFRSTVHLELHLSGCFSWIHVLKRRLGILDVYEGPPQAAKRHSGSCLCQTLKN